VIGSGGSGFKIQKLNKIYSIEVFNQRSNWVYLSGEQFIKLIQYRDLFRSTEVRRNHSEYMVYLIVTLASKAFYLVSSSVVLLLTTSPESSLTILAEATILVLESIEDWSLVFLVVSVSILPSMET